MTEIRKGDEYTLTVRGRVHHVSPNFVDLTVEGAAQTACLPIRFFQENAEKIIPPLPTTLGTIIQDQGGKRYVRLVPFGRVGNPWREIGGSAEWFNSAELAGSKVLYLPEE